MKRHLKRHASEDEKTLFRETVEHSRPKIVAKPKPKKPIAKTKGFSGLDGNTRKRLQKGALTPDAKLDLHGFTHAAAHRALLPFLRAAYKSGARLILVVTGKGNPNQEGGTLRDMVPRWLNEPDFAALIATIETAHVRHGGGGALYVYLRK